MDETNSGDTSSEQEKTMPPVLENTDHSSNQHQPQQQQQKQLPVQGNNLQQPQLPQDYNFEEHNESSAPAAPTKSEVVATHIGDNNSSGSGAAKQDSTKQDDPKNNHDVTVTTTKQEEVSVDGGDDDDGGKQKLMKSEGETQHILDNSSLPNVPVVKDISSNKQNSTEEELVNPTDPTPATASGPPAAPATAPVPSTSSTSLPPTALPATTPAATAIQQQDDTNKDVIDNGDTEMLEKPGANKNDIAESKSLPKSPSTEDTSTNKEKINTEEPVAPATRGPEFNTSSLAASDPDPVLPNTSTPSRHSPKSLRATVPSFSPIHAPSPPTGGSSSSPTSNPAPTGAAAPTPVQAASNSSSKDNSPDSKAYPSLGTVKPSPDVMSLLYRLQEAQLALTTAANRRVQKSNQTAFETSELPPSQRELLAANATTVRSLQENAKAIAYNLERRKHEAAFAIGEEQQKNNEQAAGMQEEMGIVMSNSKKDQSIPNTSTSPTVEKDLVTGVSKSDSKSLAPTNNLEGGENPGPDSPENQSDTDSTPIIVDEEMLKSDEVLEPYDVVPSEAPMDRLERARKAAYLAKAPTAEEQPFKQAESTNWTRAPPKPNDQNNLMFQAAVAAAKGAAQAGNSPTRITARAASSATKAAPLKQYTKASKHSSHQRPSQSFPPKYVTHPNNDGVTNSNLRRLPGSSKKDTPQGRSPPRTTRAVQYPLPTGPTAPLKPIRRLAKIRPYANQAVAFSQEQILKAIPKDASSVFHIMDRRVNLDSFGNSRHDDPRKDVPIYSLLRAWVQDDPYRQIPPADPNLPHVTKKGAAMSRKRPHEYITENGTANAEPDRKKKRETADVVGHLEMLERQARLPIPPTLPASDFLKQEMIQQAKGKQDSKRSQYNKRLKKTLKGLRKRGIVLN